MNTALIISVVVVVAAIAGLVFGLRRGSEYPQSVRRRGIALLLVGLGAGGLHALIDGHVIRSSSILNTASTTVDILFFALLLVESIRLRKASHHQRS